MSANRKYIVWPLEVRAANKALRNRGFSDADIPLRYSRLGHYHPVRGPTLDHLSYTKTCDAAVSPGFIAGRGLKHY